LGTLEGTGISVGFNNRNVTSCRCFEGSIPFTKRHKAASEHAITLGSIFIDAQLEWESIFSGRFTDDEIMNRRHRLMRLQHDAERTSFPDGLATQDLLFSQAEQEAQDYFKTTYGLN
jgi:hypothetical protein